MRLPGTRYQEHGWEHVRKLLGQCSLQIFRHCDTKRLCADGGAAEALDWYVDALAGALLGASRGARADAPGNNYGESVFELALGLGYELQAQPGYWDAFLTALAKQRDDGGSGSGAFGQGAGADAILRKKVNDMFVGLRDKVDADNYQVALGRPCSPNKMYTYRMLDTAYHALAALFADWRQHEAQVGAILGRTLGGIPIEARQMKSIAACKPEWLIRWSETLERFGGAPGPLHTRSKRFASLKNNPATIAAMLAEIGDYEELSANLDRADDWRGDAGEAGLWLEDYWRVMNEADEASGADERILAEPETEAEPGADYAPGEQGGEAGAPVAEPGPPLAPEPGDEAAASAVSLPPRYIELARAAQDGASWALRVLKDDTLAIRLAVYQKILGAEDDSYPDAWCDPATGALPTLPQLAALDGISMPTLRKRRNEAIARLRQADGAMAKGE